VTRTHRRLAVSAGLAVLLLSGCGDSRLQPGAAAIVGSQRISVEVLQKTTEASLADPQAQESLGADRAGFQRQVLGRLVRSEVLTQAARSRGVSVTDGDVARRLEEFVQGAGSRAALEEQAAQGGIPADALESFVRDIVLTEKLGDELVRDIDVPQADLRAAYDANIGQFDQIRSRHILLEDEATARRILAEVQADESRFTALAAQFSIDTSNADTGGDLGLAPRGQFVPEFEELAYSLPIGDYGVVQTQFGWHVVNPTERITTTLAEATPVLRREALAADISQRTQEVFVQTSDRLGVSVNPRFGRWDAETVQVQADDSPNGVLVVPSPAAEPPELLPPPPPPTG